jgi:hypothetical protein
MSNERYRRDAKIGSSRKSASSAKPKRAVGESAASVGKPKPKVKEKKRTDWSGLPSTPEIRKWRRIWWVLLSSGMVLVVAGMFIPALQTENVQRIVLTIVLACSLSAISIDLFIIRRLRKEAMAAGKKKSKGDSGVKPDDSASAS